MSSLTGAVWNIRRRAPKELFARLEDVPPLAVQLLHNRGYDDEAAVREFLEGPLPPHDPYLLDGMDAAVARVAQALAQGERVYVYGDYDVDGVTGTALLLETFEMLGAVDHALHSGAAVRGLWPQPRRDRRDRGAGTGADGDGGLRDRRRRRDCARAVARHRHDRHRPPHRRRRRQRRGGDAEPQPARRRLSVSRAFGRGRGLQAGAGAGGGNA